MISRNELLDALDASYDHPWMTLADLGFQRSEIDRFSSFLHQDPVHGRIFLQGVLLGALAEEGEQQRKQYASGALVAALGLEAFEGEPARCICNCARYEHGHMEACPISGYEPEVVVIDRRPTDSVRSAADEQPGSDVT